MLRLRLFVGRVWFSLYAEGKSEENRGVLLFEKVVLVILG